jgi:hypothetical protein
VLGAPPRFATELKSFNCQNPTLRSLDEKRILGNVDASRVHQNEILLYLLCKDVENFAWNFPFTSNEGDDEKDADLILATFLSVALFWQLCIASRLLVAGGASQNILAATPKFGLAPQGDQFSRWSVMRSAGLAGWRLLAWCEFNHRDFPKYKHCRANGDPFPYEHGRFCVRVPCGMKAWLWFA